MEAAEEALQALGGGVPEELLGSPLPGDAALVHEDDAVGDLADKEHLVVFSAATPQGDTARPQFLLDSLTRNIRSFSPLSGLNGDAPSTTTVADFARRIIEAQGASAEAAARLHSGQSVALAAIESRFSETGSVNIDQEMAHLVQLQTAYGANARVMSAVREMLDLLMRM